jgi:hypothetical protein
MQTDVGNTTSFTRCPGCKAAIPDRGFKLVFNKHNKPFNLEGKRSTRCVCGEYWHHWDLKPKPKRLLPERRGRPRLGKTHKRSDSAKQRRNAIWNSKCSKKKGGKYSRYRFRNTELIQNVLDVGFPPKWENRILYHKNRYIKAGKPWVDRPKPWGFRLMNSKRYSCPDPVVRALVGIYQDTNKVVLRPPRKPKVFKPSSRVRTPLSRDRTAVIGFYENQIYLARSAGDKVEHKRLQKRLQTELDIQEGRPVPKWDGSVQRLSAHKATIDDANAWYYNTKRMKSID